MEVRHLWGMTELSPLGTVGGVKAPLAHRRREDILANKVKQGRCDEEGVEAGSGGRRQEGQGADASWAVGICLTGGHLERQRPARGSGLTWRASIGGAAR